MTCVFVILILRLMWHALSWSHDFPGLPLWLKLWLCDSVILWLWYMTLIRPGHLMFHYIHVMTYLQEHTDARTYWTWYIIPSIFVIVLDTVEILIFYSDILLVPYYVFMFLLLFLCTLASPVLTDLYIFLVSRSESRYRELIIEHSMVQSLLRWARFSYLTCLIQIWWMVLSMI